MKHYFRVPDHLQLFDNTQTSILVAEVESGCNVNEAAFQVGMADIKYFREQFNKLFGMNPSEYIKKYRKPFQKNFQMNK